MNEGQPAQLRWRVNARAQLDARICTDDGHYPLTAVRACIPALCILNPDWPQVESVSVAQGGPAQVQGAHSTLNIEHVGFGVFFLKKTATRAAT